MATKRDTRAILLARGYTEADLDSDLLKGLLNDAKFRTAIESEAAAADAAAAESQRLQGLLDEDAQWYSGKVEPALKKSMQDVADADGRAAAAEAKLKRMQAYGLEQVAATQDAGAGAPAAVAASTSTGTPGKYLTEDDFNRHVTSLGQQWGTATSASQAQLHDIAEEHRELFGSRISGGMTQLDSEWKEARDKRRYSGSIKQFWEEKYKVPDKRESTRHEAEEKRINAAVDERFKAKMSEAANPFTRTPASSRNPFTNRAAASSQKSVGATSGEGPGSGRPLQPWDDPDRHSRRLQKAVSKFVQ